MSELQIKVLNRSPFPLPEYATSGSAGMDLRADLRESLYLEPMQRIRVPTGIFLELPAGFEAQLRPRSGLAFRQGLTLLNAPGTVDSDYRGEIQVILINLSREPQQIQPGDRIAQMVVAPVSRVLWKESTILDGTGRGGGGFGHTGKS